LRDIQERSSVLEAHEEEQKKVLQPQKEAMNRKIMKRQAATKIQIAFRNKSNK
jgi:hypothetical protein